MANPAYEMLRRFVEEEKKPLTPLVSLGEIQELRDELELWSLLGP